MMLLILRSMTSTDDRLWYTPPPFSPFEFDDSYLPGDQHPRARRWMSGFNGAIGEPAQNVQLGWRSDSGAQVAIGTFEDKAQFTDSSGRMSAVWMLDGLQFVSPGPPVAYAVKSGTDMQRLAQQDELWLESELVVDGASTRAVRAVLRGFHVGYARTRDVVIAFVAGGLGNDIVHVRSLRDDSQDYAANPNTPHTLIEMDAEWRLFFQERPDLDLERINPRTASRFSLVCVERLTTPAGPLVEEDR